jgi:hypothetical protein
LATLKTPTDGEKVLLKKWIRENFRLNKNDTAAHDLLHRYRGDYFKVSALIMIILSVGEQVAASQDESLDDTNPPWPWSSKEEFDQRCDEAKAIVDAYYAQQKKG